VDEHGGGAVGGERVRLVVEVPRVKLKAFSR
jgi:hypothetical protein